MALPTEAWRGAEIRRRLAENIYVDLPGPVEHLTHNPKIGGLNPTIDTGRDKMEKKVWRLLVGNVNSTEPSTSVRVLRLN